MAKSLFAMILISMIALNSASFHRKKKSKKNTPSPTAYPTEEIDCEWTDKWLDIDNKYGWGDYERVNDFKNKGIYVCGKYDINPLDAICRDTKTKVYFDDYDFTSGVKYTYCDERGFVCNDGWAVACPDFEVQFCCPKNSGSSGGKKRRDSDDGDEGGYSDSDDDRR